MHIPFNKYEKVLLIQTYMKIKDRPKSEWQGEVRKLSDLYRNYALQRGLEIDDSYRNVAGITTQIRHCVYTASSGGKCLSGGAAWMHSLMELYTTNPAAFQTALREAYEHMHVQEITAQSDLPENDVLVKKISSTTDAKASTDKISGVTWDKHETAQMVELYYALREVDPSEWDEMIRQECLTLENYHCEKYHCQDSTRPIFTITDLAMKIYGFKLLEAGQGIEGEDYSSLDKEIFLMRSEHKDDFESIIYPDEKELLPVAMERQWDDYEIARLTYECANAKGTSIVTIIKDFHEHLKKYVSDLGYVMDVSRSKGAINRHALELDYLLTEGHRGKKGGTKADENIVSMYKYRNSEFEYLLKEANKRLGYEQDNHLTDGAVNHSLYGETADNKKELKEEKAYYREDNSSVSKSEFFVVEKPEQETADKFRKVMEKEYPNGIRLNSKLDFLRFAGLFKDKYGTEISQDIFTTNITSITYDDNGRRKLKSNEEQRNFIDSISNDFEDIFAKGFSCIYKNCVYPHYQSAVQNQMKIYSESDFWSVLERSLYRYNVNGFGHITPKGISADADSDIRSYIEDVQREITYDELEQELWFIPIDKIKQVVRTTPSIINMASNTYMSIKAFPVTNDELSQIKRVIHDGIAAAPARQLQAEECRRQIYVDAECKSVKINTEVFSATGFQKALGYLLRDDFNFTPKFVTYKNIEMDTGKMYREFCAERDQFTLEELEEFSKEIDTPIRHDIIHDSMVRIDENTFVKDSLVSFDAQKIDTFIEENICTGKYISLKKISSLVSNFPSIENYRWTGYLLESYIYSFSEKFELLNSSFSKNDFNGVIIRRDAGKLEFNDIIMDVLTHKECTTEEEAINELKEDGYISRANYKGIDIILEKAKVNRSKLKGE